MIEQIVEPLLKWYDGNARVLPWREQATPYRVWVSEIMLQQTRVEAVKPFFERFTKALPGVSELAECPEDDLLKLWEGLGYYNRVKNMQKAARQIVDEYGGNLPPDYELLLTLPGIGPYTAGAVASIAYDIPAAAVDGNVLRVISRITASDADIMKPAVRKAVEKALLTVMPQNRAGDFNQALMELGAMVCVPNGIAKCPACPLHDICAAREQDIVMELPKKAAKKPRRVEERTVLIIKDGDRAAIRKRPDRGLLAGLYELPNLPGHMAEQEVLDYLRERNFTPLHIQRLEQAKHIFSHIEWRMIGYAVRVAALDDGCDEELIFIEPRQTEAEYPIPAAYRAYTEHLNIKLGQKKYREREREETL